MKKYWMGLDIGGTKCAVLLAGVNAGIQLKDKISFKTAKDFKSAYEELCGAMESILSRNGTDFDCIRAVGISCGGPLDSRKGIILCPPNLPGWVNIPLPAMLRERFGVQAYIQNDANACALVEWKLGAGRGTDDMIFVTMGTGIGGGVIAGGRLLCGHNDLCGEIGHMRLTEDGPTGYCKAGSFEGHASGGGIHRQAVELTERMIAQGHPPAWIRDGNGVGDVNPKLLETYARKGDPDAKAFYEGIGRMLGRGLALLVDVINPERIVIGSVFIRCEDLIRTAMETELRKEALALSVRDLRVVPAQTGEALGDLASVMVAVYALEVDPMESQCEKEPQVLVHFERLFQRYPALEPCRDMVMEAYLLLRGCYQKGGKALIVGNGGSCADSEHMVGELMKGFYLKRPLPAEKKDKIRVETDGLLPDAADLFQQSLPAIALTGHTALTTAVQNDCDPSLAAAQQVVGYGLPGDVVIGISTSGGAKNVALAVAAGKALGLKTIGLTGGSGGRLARLCDCAVIVPAGVTADVQEYHLPVYHTLCAMLEAKFFAQ